MQCISNCSLHDYNRTQCNLHVSITDCLDDVMASNFCPCSRTTARHEAQQVHTPNGSFTSFNVFLSAIGCHLNLPSCHLKGYYPQSSNLVQVFLADGKSTNPNHGQCHQRGTNTPARVQQTNDIRLHSTSYSVSRLFQCSSQRCIHIEWSENTHGISHLPGANPISISNIHACKKGQSHHP